MIRVTLETFNRVFLEGGEESEAAQHHGTLRIWPDSTEGLYHVQLWETAPTGHFHCAAEFEITGKMGDYWGLVRTALAEMRRGESNEW